MLRLGLTGGIGSGKSTVAALLAQRGAVVVDTDAIARQLTAPGGGGIAGIVQAFGPQALDAQGALDRAAMRARVFQDPQARQRLEAILHPLILEEADRQTEQARRQGARWLVLDIPLLAESGGRWRSRLDQVLVVDCEPETQITRVMARSGLSAAQAQQILNAQASRAQRLALADHVIFNGASVSPAQLAQTVNQWATRFGL